MFEFIIQYKSSAQKKRFNNFSLGGIRDRHSSYHFDDGVISVDSLAHRKLKYKQVFENEHYLILINGIIIGRHKSGKVNYNADDIALELKESSFKYSNLKGEFALFVYDKNKQTLNIFTDPIGLKPIYYGVIESITYLSNDLNLLKEIDKETDRVTLLEKVLFTYPISNNTFLKNFFYLSPGSKYILDSKRFDKEVSFSLRDFVFNAGRQNFSYSHFIDLFNRNVAQRSSFVDKPLVTLTGGFDGRAIVSSLLYQKIDFYAYSFGAKEGENTQIPEDIAKKIGIQYQPVFLDDNYERQYAFYAKQAIKLSDGVSSFERANYNYVFDQLDYQSPVLLSGLIGGEILGVLFSKTDFFNEDYYTYFLESKNLDVDKTLNEKGVKDFINISDSEKKGLINRIEERKHLLNTAANLGNESLLYMYDLLSMGFRRFYGAQMHQERYQFENLLPFFDLDLLEYLFSTTFKYRYEHSFTNKTYYKFISRKPQARIIKNNFPVLADLPVDRGFNPKHLLNTFYFPWAYFKLYKRNIASKTKEFFSENWSQLLYKDLLNKDFVFNDFCDNHEIKNYLKNYKIIHYNKNINHLLSAVYWAS